MNYDKDIHDIKTFCVNLNDKLINQQETIGELVRIIEYLQRGLESVHFGEKK
jgi:hypothetical protein